MRSELKTAARLLLAGLFVLGGVSGGVAFAQSSGSTLSPEAQRAMRRGRDAAKRQEWKRAIELFGQARKAAPMSPYALYNLAVANDKAGRREHFAIAWYRAYLASAPDATNAGQVRDRIAKLEVQLEANARDLIRKAKVINLRAWSSIGKLSEAQVEVGDFAGAMETLEQIPPEHRALGYTDIAYAQARAGDIAEAMETASRITNPFFRGKAYIPIAEEQAWSGNIAGAKATASRITYWGQKNEAYSIIASWQAKAGDKSGARESIAQAQESAARIEDGDDKREAYIRIAEVQAKAGDKSGARESIAQAQESAARIEDGDDKREAYIRIAEAQAEAGDFAGAKATAARFIDTEFHMSLYFAGDARSRTYKYIALKQAKAGDIAGAKATAALITEEKSSAYEKIAIAQAKVGDIAGARKTAEMITYAPIRERTYSKIAQNKPHVGDEVEDWTELVGSFVGAFMGSWAEDDYQRFVQELKNKANNDDIAYGFAQAAVGYAKALNRLRNIEAKWQKRRAGAAR